MKSPKTLGACADSIYRLQQRRLALQKKVDALRKEEGALKAHFVQLCRKERVQAAQGKEGRASFKPSQKPVVKDYDEFYRHLASTGEFDLLQKRLSDTAVRERWEAEVAVPGVESVPVLSWSVGRASTKR